MKSRSNMVFLCSRYRGDIEKNTELARRHARFIAKCGYAVVAPHLLYPQFLNEDDEAERLEGIMLGLDQLECCERIFIFGTSISEGMRFEIERAKELGIPAVLFDDDETEIKPDTLRIDGRVDSNYRQTVKGLKFR